LIIICTAKDEDRDKKMSIYAKKIKENKEKVAAVYKD